MIKPDVPKSSAWYGIALPAIFVINADGMISHRFSTEDYRQRPDVERVLATLRKQ